MQNASSNSSMEGARTSRDKSGGFDGISPSSKSAVMYVLSVSPLIPGLKADASAADPSGECSEESLGSHCIEVCDATSLACVA